MRMRPGRSLCSTLLAEAPDAHCAQEYKEVFAPLILEECASQIMRGMDEGEVLAPHPALATGHEQVCACTCVPEQQ